MHILIIIIIIIVIISISISIAIILMTDKSGMVIKWFSDIFLYHFLFPANVIDIGHYQSVSAFCH